MCGIAGLLTPTPEAGLAAWLEPMRRALRHRGPDGDGVWASPTGLAAFVHTRLAIFDSTPAAAQPLSIDGRLTVVYNGALYNHRELRAELVRDGVAFETRSDTEVLLRLYQRDGAAAFTKLRGMFALAIWDEAQRIGVLARDRFGIKPLYLATRGGRLVFASEIRALLVSGLVRRTLDAAAVYGYFRTGSVPEPLTILEGVRALQPGSVLTWQDGRESTLTFAEAWPTGEPSDHATRDEVAQALRDSVAVHQSGDVPVGIFLSGGVDSTALLALAHEAGARDPRTFTLALPGTAGDEGPAARQTAARFGAAHAECAMTAAHARAAIDPFVQAIDQPGVDGLNTFVMARLAAAHGVHSVLSGIGADELFGGYDNFQRVPRLYTWHRRAAGLGLIASSAGRTLEAFAADSRLRRVGDLLQQPPSLSAAYETCRGVFTRREAVLLTARFTGEQVEPPPALPTAATRPDADAVTELELTRYVRNQLLRDADMMGMAFGVEIRTPYLDGPLVTTVARVPAVDRIRPGKALLRSALPDPRAVAAGSGKMCFQFPFRAWLASEWAELAAAVQVPAGVRLDTWYRTWSVFILTAWLKQQGLTTHA